MSNLPIETNQQGCLNCPFCAGFEAVQVQQVQVTPRAKPDFAVVCPHCDARGPWAYNKDMAVRFWNDGYPAARAAVRFNSAPTEIRSPKPGRPRNSYER
jgi:hypothetical protein